MLIHISPKLIEHSVLETYELIDVRVPELGMTLTNGKEITTCRPFPNQYYLVACCSTSHGDNGLLIETNDHVDSLTVVTRWKVDGAIEITHTASLNIVDNEHELVSDNMLLWGKFGGRHDGDFEDRTPETMKAFTPLNAQPIMQTKKAGSATALNATDSNAAGIIVERTQILDLPTLEVERLSSLPSLCRKFPSRKNAFKAENVELVAS